MPLGFGMKDRTQGNEQKFNYNFLYPFCFYFFFVLFERSALLKIITNFPIIGKSVHLAQSNFLGAWRSWSLMWLCRSSENRIFFFHCWGRKCEKHKSMMNIWFVKMIYWFTTEEIEKFFVRQLLRISIQNLPLFWRCRLFYRCRKWNTCLSAS